MTALAASPAPRERFSAGVIVSAVLHAGLFGTLLFGGTLFPNGSGQIGGTRSNGGGLKVALASGEGLFVRRNPVVDSEAPPSKTPGEQSLDTAPKSPASRTAEKTKTKIPKPTGTQPREKALGAIPLPGGKTTKTPPEKPTPDRSTEGPTASSTAANVAGGSSGITGNGSSVNVQRGGVSNGSGSTNTQFGDASFGTKFPDYSRRLQQAISPYFDPPVSSRGRTVTIRLTIAKNGAASGIDFEQKSQIVALDTAARSAVTRASLDKKIPPLPGDFRGSSVQALVIFESER